MLRFFVKSTEYTWGKLCRQYLLLAGLALLCLFLPGILGNAAETALSDGVEFAGITLAVTAPEDDPIPQLLEESIGKMRDVRQYCTLRAMGREDALQALADGEVAAVLELPEDFIQGILTGTNPDVTLLVDENRPTEALLTLWVGQSATDLLAAVQSGIYAVLEEYDAAAIEGLGREAVVAGINLCYVNLTLNRQDFFTLRSVSATGTLPIALHYALSLFAWLCLSLAPLFFPVYDGSRLSSRRRLRSLGIGSGICCLSDVAACALTLLPISLLCLTVIFDGRFWLALPCAFAFSLFCALFGSLCALFTGSAARCGSLSFLLSLAGLFLSGGILPPVLLPKTLQALSWLSPVAWLRSIAAALLGYEVPFRCFLALTVSAMLMLTLVLLLYGKRMDQQEVAV